MRFVAPDTAASCSFTFITRAQHQLSLELKTSRTLFAELGAFQLEHALPDANMSRLYSESMLVGLVT